MLNQRSLNIDWIRLIHTVYITIGERWIVPVWISRYSKSQCKLLIYKLKILVSTHEGLIQVCIKGDSPPSPWENRTQNYSKPTFVCASRSIFAISGTQDKTKTKTQSHAIPRPRLVQTKSETRLELEFKLHDHWDIKGIAVRCYESD